jgi:hypothetical protein
MHISLWACFMLVCTESLDQRPCGIRHLYCPFAVYANVRLPSRKSGLGTLQSLLYH